MATILPAVRAAQSLARRAVAVATGMAAILDMGTQLATYRRDLAYRIRAIRSRGLEGDWAALERDAGRVEWPRGEPASYR
jgi:hypothetical protein